MSFELSAPFPFTQSDFCEGFTLLAPSFEGRFEGPP